MQAQVEGGGSQTDASRDAAERTLAALTEQNQRLTAEKAAADAAARDVAVRAYHLVFCMCHCQLADGAEPAADC